MDFLGLRTLTVIQNACHQVERSKGIHIDIDNIDYDDKQVLESIGTGRTEGVFQVESSGMNYLEARQPGRYYCRYFSVPSRPHGLYPQVFKRKEQSKGHYL